MEIVEAKVVVLGLQGVGKTSVINTYVSGGFNRRISPTIGASFSTHSLIRGNFSVKLQVWDTAGQERFRSMAPMYYRRANAALLVFDITSSASFCDVKQWVSELRKNIESPLTLALVGNKSDLASSRNVTPSEAEDYAAMIGAKYFETSAVTREGVGEVFDYIADVLIQDVCEKRDAQNQAHIDLAEHEMVISLEQKPQLAEKRYCC